MRRKKPPHKKKEIIGIGQCLWRRYFATWWHFTIHTKDLLLKFMWVCVLFTHSCSCVIMKRRKCILKKKYHLDVIVYVCCTIPFMEFIVSFSFLPLWASSLLSTTTLMYACNNSRMKEEEKSILKPAAHAIDSIL